MNPGQMRSRIKIYKHKKPTPPYNDITDINDDADLFANVAAKKEDKLTASIWGTKAENAINRKQFVIRYKRGVVAGMRLEHSEESYDIKAVAELGSTRQWMILLAERVDSIGI